MYSVQCTYYYAFIVFCILIPLNSLHLNLIFSLVLFQSHYHHLSARVYIRSVVELKWISKFYHVYQAHCRQDVSRKERDSKNCYYILLFFSLFWLGWIELFILCLNSWHSFTFGFSLEWCVIMMMRRATRCHSFFLSMRQKELRCNAILTDRSTTTTKIYILFTTTIHHHHQLGMCLHYYSIIPHFLKLFVAFITPLYTLLIEIPHTFHFNAWILII